MSFRSKKLLAMAKDRPCVLCGARETTVSAHANSTRLGKGTGIKAPDHFVAWVCGKHHDQIDGKAPLDPGYDSPFEMWAWAHLLTEKLWFEEGVVVVK